MSTSQYITESQETVEYLPLLDWLQFTVHVEDASALPGEAALWVAVLGGGSALSAARFGYTHGYSVCGSGMVLYHPERVEMGVHVVLPSSALAYLPEVGDEFGGMHHYGQAGETLTPERLLRLALEAGAKFSRLDVCQDTSKVALSEVAAALASPLLVTKARRMRSVVEFGRENETAAWQESGGGYYVGRRGGRRMVRFYDKAAEQGLVTDGRVWTRCEVEFRGESAQAAALHLAGGRSVGDLIVSVVDFRNEDDVNVTRRTRCDWWHAWVGVAARVSFALQKVQKTVEDALAWVEKAVAPTLAMLNVAGADLRFLVHRITEKGFGRLDEGRRQRAIRYRDSGYMLVPDVPDELRDVITDFEEWVINRAFQCADEAYELGVI